MDATGGGHLDGHGRAVRAGPQLYAQVLGPDGAVVACAARVHVAARGDRLDAAAHGRVVIRRVAARFVAARFVAARLVAEVHDELVRMGETQLGAEDGHVAGEPGEPRGIRADRRAAGAQEIDALVPRDPQLLGAVADVIEHRRADLGRVAVEDRAVEAAETSLAHEGVASGLLVERDELGAVEHVGAVDQAHLATREHGGAPDAVDVESVGVHALAAVEPETDVGLRDETLEIGGRSVGSIGARRRTKRRASPRQLARAVVDDDLTGGAQGGGLDVGGAVSRFGRIAGRGGTEVDGELAAEQDALGSGGGGSGAGVPGAPGFPGLAGSGVGSRWSSVLTTRTAPANAAPSRRVAEPSWSPRKLRSTRSAQVMRRRSRASSSSSARKTAVPGPVNPAVFSFSSNQNRSPRASSCGLAMSSSWSWSPSSSSKPGCTW